MEDLVVCRPSCFWGRVQKFFYINALLESKSSSEAKTPGDWVAALLGSLGGCSQDLCTFQSSKFPLKKYIVLRVSLGQVNTALKSSSEAKALGSVFGSREFHAGSGSL